MGGRVNINDVESVWDLIENYKIQQSKSSQNTGSVESKGSNENKRKATNDDKEAHKKKKTELENCNGKEIMSESQQSDVSTPKLACENSAEKFSFKRNIMEILEKKNSISATKLQKKVLKCYKTEMGCSEVTEKTIKKYNKKLKKLPNIVITENMIELVTNK